MRGSPGGPAIVWREYWKEASRCTLQCAFDIGIDHPWSCGVGPCQAKNFFDRVVTSSARAKPVADSLEAGFPKGLQRVFHQGLDPSISDGGDPHSTREFIPLSFWYDALLTERYRDRRHVPWLVDGALTCSPVR